MKYIIYLNDKEYDIKNNIFDCFNAIEEFCKKYNRVYDIFCVDKINEFGKDCIIIRLCHDYRQRYYTFKIKVYLESIIDKHDILL